MGVRTVSSTVRTFSRKILRGNLFFLPARSQTRDNDTLHCRTLLTVQYFTMAARDLTEEEVADLREAFSMFDINGDGEWKKEKECLSDSSHGPEAAAA